MPIKQGGTIGTIGTLWHDRNFDTQGRAEPLFGSPQQALNVTFNMARRLSFLMTWCLLWLAHLTLALVAAAALWWFDVRAQQAAAAIRSLAASMPVAVAATLGVSVLGAIAGYWKLCQWAVRKTRARWMLRYLTQDVRG